MPEIELFERSMDETEERLQRGGGMLPTRLCFPPNLRFAFLDNQDIECGISLSRAVSYTHLTLPTKRIV